MNTQNKEAPKETKLSPCGAPFIIEDMILSTDEYIKQQNVIRVLLTSITIHDVLFNDGFETIRNNVQELNALTKNRDYDAAKELYDKIIAEITFKTTKHFKEKYGVDVTNAKYKINLDRLTYEYTTEE